MLKHNSPVSAYTLLALIVSIPGAAAADDGFKVESAKWDRERHRLNVTGKGKSGKTVTLGYSANDEVIGTKTVREGEWRFRQYGVDPVPCTVRVRQSDGQTALKSVEEAPSNCDEGIADDGGGNGDSGVQTAGGEFTILAANDLGMHCADTDYRIFSILPPYNVIHAQVLRKGGEPVLMTPAEGIGVTYKAVDANIVDPNDPDLPPIAVDSINSTSENDLATGVYKSNFWNPADAAFNQLFGFLAYEKLYPPGVLAAFPLRDPSDDGVRGLPAPDLEKFYLTDPGVLEADQSTMPGKSNPYNANQPQPFHGFVENLPFFVNFPFGYTVENFRRYTAEGVPILPTDDAGRLNAYPLMRIQAHDPAGKLLAEVDTVLPVASEADCQSCHLEQEVCTDLELGISCGDIANHYQGTRYSASFITADNLAANNVPGDTSEQKALNAAKINILRLHDAKNGTALDQQRSVVCANCHYSPALDLAHLGPTDLNGKQQTRHQSMSRVMHSYHASLPARDGYDSDELFDDLFPLMPIADQRTAEETQSILEQTCYSCHPGKRTKCLRGAMSDGGIVCQDCHGQGSQVGDDFTENFPDKRFNVTVDAGHPDFNAGVAGKRVSWASEPKCQSCHVGDVLQVAQLLASGGLNDVLLNAADKRGNPDGLRLRMAYRITDHALNPGGGTTDLALLDYADSRFASDRPLYRLGGAGGGKGHGGLFCEGCHGSTHAIWPNANPWANDNKAAMDLQGHTGTIIECSACHQGDLGLTLEGPHGMHPVGDTRFARGHEDFAKRNANACRSCHGREGEGSVLSRTAADRVLQAKEDHITVSMPQGTPVGCGDCHENKLSNP